MMDQFDVTPLSPPAADAVTVQRVAALEDRGASTSVNRGLLFADGIRMPAGSEAVIDIFDGNRITYLPGSHWTGALPATFYGTVAALTLAWRGAVPFHACAVDIAGRAVMIAGRSGAGKSSLTAALLRHGAKLIADDLTVADLTGTPMVARGRPAIRLHPNSAATINATFRAADTRDRRGKWLVRPLARTAATWLPLAAVIELTPATAHETEPLAMPLLQHLFRPRWLAAMPRHQQRIRQVVAATARIATIRFPAIEHFDAGDQDCRARRALARVTELIG